MGNLQHRLLEMKSTILGRIFLKPKKVTPFQGCLTNDSSNSHCRNEPKGHLKEERGIADLEQGLVPLRKSDHTTNDAVRRNAEAQKECDIDTVHVQLGPSLSTIYMYETGQNTPLDDICFASNEDLSNGVENYTTSPQAQELITYGGTLPSSSSNTPSPSQSLRTRYESKQSGLGGNHAEIQPDIPRNLRPVGPSDSPTGLPHRASKPPGSGTVFELSEPETNSLEKIIEDMLYDCLQHLPISAFPLQVPEFDVDFAFMASLRLPPIYPLVPRKGVIISEETETIHGHTLKRPRSRQQPEERPPNYTLQAPGVPPVAQTLPYFPKQAIEVADLLRIAANALYQKVQLDGAKENLKGEKSLDSHHDSTFLKRLDHLVKSWPDNIMEAAKAFRDVLGDGTILSIFVSQCLPSEINETSWKSNKLSREDNIRRFIGVYESVVPRKQEKLQASEKLSVEELGAYARAIISINTVSKRSLASPSQRSNKPVARSSMSAPRRAHEKRSSHPVQRPLPTYSHPLVNPSFHGKTVPPKKVDNSQITNVTSSGLARSRISRLPEDEKLLYRKLLSVIWDKKCCRLLLQGRGESQSILDLLHHLLSFPQITGAARGELLTVLVRLATSVCLYPRSLMHAGDPQVDKGPVTGGGYSEIFRGNLQEQRICVKVVRLYREASKKQKNIKAFMREIVLWGQLDHPNILPFYGVWNLNNTEDKICLVSPWMDNGTLPEYLKSCPDANKLLLTRDVAMGLEYLHNRMLVHGDLKGANILITSCGRACLADFGLASVNNTESVRFDVLETTGHEDATPRYEAPELFLGDDNSRIHRTTASDMYAFGCVCYEIFTGKLPFYEVTSRCVILLKMIKGETPTRPSLATSPELAKKITNEIWSFITSCWSLNSGDRPSASDCLSTGLLKYLKDVRPAEQELWSSSKYKSVGRETAQGRVKDWAPSTWAPFLR